MLKTYDFQCPKCNKVYEDILIEANSTYLCPDCKIECKRLMSAPVAYSMFREDVWARNKTVAEFNKPKYKPKRVTNAI
jgi:hypothetical protein